MARQWRNSDLRSKEFLGVEFSRLPEPVPAGEDDGQASSHTHVK
jgi:hypothetical protein